MNKVELEIISIFVRLADLLNLPKTVGEIYGLLFISETPMCLDDLMNKLKISKGSTSQGLKKFIFLEIEKIIILLKIP